MKSCHASHSVQAVAVAVLCGVLTCCGLSSGGNTHQSGPIGTITDTIGRQVKVPAQVKRVAAIGTIPVMISYVITIGAQGTLATRGGQSGPHGLGATGAQGFASTELYRIVAPNALTAPSVEAAIMAPVDTEALLQAHPDVVLAPDLSIAKGAIDAGLPVVILGSGATGDEVKKDIKVLGELFGKQETADAYAQYFDTTVGRVNAGVAGLPEARRPRAAFVAFSPLRVPIYSTNYMFGILGATSITANIPGNNVQISTEQLLRWNPDVIVVQQVADQQALYSDPQYASINAVSQHRVFLIPMALQTWTDNSPLMPLGLEYLAKAFYPDRFTAMDLSADVHAFFQEFCGIDLTADEVTKILRHQI